MPDRKEIEGKLKLVRGQQYQLTNKTKGELTRIRDRSPDTGLYDANLADGSVQQGVRTSNTPIPSGQIVRATPSAGDLLALDWRNRRPENPPPEIEEEVSKAVVLYSRSDLEESAVSILYRIEVTLPQSCTCPTWDRVGNKCYQVCSPAGTYTSLQSCLSAPTPTWPPPTGEDGRGGYWVLYVGYKIGTPAAVGYSYSNGAWEGGLFYEAFSDNCTSGKLDTIEHFAPTAFVEANPEQFPKEVFKSPFFYDYSLPMIPLINDTVYPGGILAALKGSITTNSYRRVSDNGWFFYIVYDSDIYFPATNTWYAGSDIAYGVCFVGKYVQAADFTDNGGGVPSPPSEIAGFNISGVTLFQNRASFECGGGGDTPHEEPPRERKAYQYYLGGSKSPPLLLCQINKSEDHEYYLTTTNSTKKENGQIVTDETVNFLVGKHSDNSWCKILNFEIKDREVAKTVFVKPTLPPINNKDWRRSLLDYTPPAGTSGNPVIDLYRKSLLTYNMIADLEQSTYHLFYFETGQSIDGQPLANLIKTTDINNKAEINYLFQKGATLVSTQKVKVPKIFSLGTAQAEIIAIAAFINVQSEFFVGGVNGEDAVSLGKYKEGDTQWVLSAVQRRFQFFIKSELSQSKFKRLEQTTISPNLDTEKTSFENPKLPELNPNNPEDSFSQTYEFPFPTPPTPCLKDLLLKPFRNLLTTTQAIIIDPEQEVSDDEGKALGKLIIELKKLPSERNTAIKFKVSALREEDDACTIGEGVEKTIKLFGLGIPEDQLSYYQIRDIAIAIWTQR